MTNNTYTSSNQNNITSTFNYTNSHIIALNYDDYLVRQMATVSQISKTFPSKHVLLLLIDSNSAIIKNHKISITLHKPQNTYKIIQTFRDQKLNNKLLIPQFNINKLIYNHNKCYKLIQNFKKNRQNLNFNIYNELSQKYNLANYQTIADKLFYIQQNKHNHSLDNIFKTYTYITEILEIAHTYNNTLNQINKIIYKYHFKF